MSISKNKETLKPINWAKVKDGAFFSGVRRGKRIVGQITKFDGDIYLCTNHFDMDGLCCPIKRGYKYSYTLKKGTLNILKSEFTKFNVLTSQPKDLKVPKVSKDIRYPKDPIFIKGLLVTFDKGYIKFGHRKISNQVVREVAKRIN